MSKKKKLFTKNKLIRYLDGEYLIYKNKTTYDARIYNVHTEDGRHIVSQLVDKIDKDAAKEYFAEMKENIEKAVGAEEAEKAYNYYMKEFDLVEKVESESEPVEKEVELDKEILEEKN